MILIIGGSNQGKLDFAKTMFPDKVDKIIDNFEEHIRDTVESNEDISVPSDAIVICDDISKGIVPIDSFERKYREHHGRALCKLASEAKEVYEVLYGIGKKIK